MAYFSRDRICLFGTFIFNINENILDDIICLLFAQHLVWDAARLHVFPFSILHSISWEEGTTILFIPSIKYTFGFLFIAIMTNAVINILTACLLFAHIQTLILGICLEVDSWAVKRGTCSGFQNADKYFPKGFTSTVYEHSNEESGASLCRGNQGQPCMFYQNRHAVMEVVLELEMWIWDMVLSGWLEKMEKKENPE